MIINSPIEPLKEKQREYTAFDMYPTTLAALGAKIDGEQLGLGFNLFSNKKTFCEKYGYSDFEKQVRRNSKFYSEKLLR